MKLHFALLLTILLFQFTGQAQWVQTGGPEGGPMLNLTRVGNEIWGGSRSGFYISQNEGANWELAEQLRNEYISSIYSKGDSVFILYEHYPPIYTWGFVFEVFMLKSYDGGQTFQPVDTIYTTQSGYDRVSLWGFGNRLILFNPDGPPILLTSDDWGETWHPATLPDPNMEIDKYYKGGNTVAVNANNQMGTQRRTYLSQDGLNTWTVIDTSSNLNLHSLKINENLIFKSYYLDTLHQNHALYFSDDYGATFTLRDTFTHLTIHYYDHNQNVLHASFNGSYQDSYDLGVTWHQVPSYTYPLLNPIITPSHDTLAIKSDSGVVRHLFDGGTIPSNSGFKGFYMNGLRKNGNTLFAITESTIFKSEDGGIIWTTFFSSRGLYNRIYDLVAKDDSIYISTDNYFIRTFDNGISWDTISVGNGAFAFNLLLVGNKIYCNGGNNKNCKVSNDHGSTWQNLQFLPSQLFCQDLGGYLLYYHDSLFCVNTGGYVYKLNPATQLWIYLGVFHQQFVLEFIYLKSISNVLIMGSENQLAYSLDGGVTWIESTGIGLPLTQGGPSPQIIQPWSLTDINGVWVGSVGRSGLYVSVDMGNNWQKITPDPMPFMPRGIVEFNGLIYCGAEYGSVWRLTQPLNVSSGYVYKDDNNNGIQNPGEQPIQGVVVYTHPGNVFGVSNQNGHFAVWSEMNGDSLKARLPDNFTHCNPDHYIINGPDSSRNFGLYIPPQINDLAIDMTNIQVFRPGFDTDIRISASNHGTMIQPTQVTLVLDPQVGYQNATPSPSVISGDTLIWNVAPIGFLQTAYINVRVQTDQAVALGSVVNFDAQITPLNNDTHPLNNEAHLTDSIVMAYDPNDKTCLQGSMMEISTVKDDQEFEYIVRFQNLGNYQADIVRIVDTLDNKFDPATFRLISASHAPVSYQISGSGIVEFLFQPIVLPAAIDDEAGSQGFVKYSVKCREGITVGTGLANQAHIYFDFNPAIQTNIATTIVVPDHYLPTGIHQPEQAANEVAQLELFPNPANSRLTLRMPNKNLTNAEVRVMDVTGKVVAHTTMSGNKVDIEVSTLAQGIYFCTVADDSGKFLGSGRFVVMR